MKRQAKGFVLGAALAASASIAFAAEEERGEFPLLSQVPARPEVFAAAPDAQARLYEEWVAALQARRRALEAARLQARGEAQR